MSLLRKPYLEWRPVHVAITAVRDRQIVLGWCPDEGLPFAVYRDSGIWRVPGSGGKELERRITLIAEIPAPS